MVAQSVLFDRGLWTEHEARVWLCLHGFVQRKIHVTKHLLRFRQYDPSPYREYRTRKTGYPGVSLIIEVAGF